MRRCSHSTWTRWNYSGYPDASSMQQVSTCTRTSNCDSYRQFLSPRSACTTVESGNSADCRQHFHEIHPKNRINTIIASHMQILFLSFHAVCPLWYFRQCPTPCTICTLTAAFPVPHSLSVTSRLASSISPVAVGPPPP